MPADVEWPTVSRIDGDTQEVTVIPQHFVLQLDLSEVAEIAPGNKLPKHGSLLVFFDVLLSDFSDDRHAVPLQDGEGVTVIYLPDPPSAYPEQETPTFPDLSHISEYEIPFYQGEVKFARHGIFFQHYMSDRVLCDNGYSPRPDPYKNAQAFQKEMGFEDVRTDDLGIHQIFGVTSRDYIPVQAFFDALPPKTLPETYQTLDDDHLLLFALRSDPNCGFSDITNIYYGLWIKESDLVEQNFGNVVAWREFE